jgi:hypothetical protein
MPSPTTGTDRSRVLSVRLTAEELETLTARATEIGVGPSTLARTYVRHALSGSSPGPSAATTTPDTWHPTLETSYTPLNAGHAPADLEPRVAALEKWVAEH